MELAYNPLGSREALVHEATRHIESHLESTIAAQGQASLFFSGGSTPGPVYEALSAAPLPWKKVTIGLVDDRWVDEDDIGSNAALIRKTLLKNKAQAASFVPMKTDHDTPQAGQASVETAYKAILSGNSLAVLGMGTDGHVCSWFPGADGLEIALDPNSAQIVQAITAKPSKVTGAYLDRMTLTYASVSQCRSVLLLITGAEKKAVLETAFEQCRTGQSDLPVSHLLAMEPANLSILHAA